MESEWCHAYEPWSREGMCVMRVSADINQNVVAIMATDIYIIIEYSTIQSLSVYLCSFVNELWALMLHATHDIQAKLQVSVIKR